MRPTAHNPTPAGAQAAILRVIRTRRPRMTELRTALAALVAAGGCALAAAPAQADVFNGRLAFTSFRVVPPGGDVNGGDIFSMNADGSDQRRLSTSPAPDRQPDWSPSGYHIAYTIRKPGETINYEVARMTASGAGYTQLTTTPTGQASSQPAWLPDASAILFRRSGPGGAASIWQMGLLGESPALRYQPPRAPLYPTSSPDRSKLLFTAVSPTDAKDRGIYVVNADGTGLTTLFDVPGAYDSAPAWSPDGTRIAFESNADVGGANPEHDMEVWTMAANGSGAVQLTHNAAHDEGPAWSPDGGTMLAYTSGPDDLHGDIHVMTSAGVHLRQLTSFAGRDESPDWQAIPAPATLARCGDLAPLGPGAHDIRAGGGASCLSAVSLALTWSLLKPASVGGFAVVVTDFGGTSRVVMTRGAQVVAFLYQP